MSRVDQSMDAMLEQASVQHLAALGYVDPWEVAAQRAAVQREQHQKLKESERLLEAGAVPAAIELLEAVVEADPDWATPRHLLARAYFRASRWADANAQLAWLEFHAVEHAELSLLRAKLAVRGRDWDAAREHAAYAKCLHEPLPAATLIVAEADYRLGALLDAEAAYREVLSANGPRAVALVGLAAIALRRGEWEESVDCSLQALEEEPRLALVHYRLGMALVVGRRTAEATTALETAAAVSPHLAGPYRWLAQLAAAEGDVELAGRRRQQAAEVIARRRAARRSAGRQ